MKQIFIKSGNVVLEDVPFPALNDDNSVIVKTLYSCASIGTESAGIKTSSLPLWKRAIKQPEKVKKFLTLLKDKGFINVYEIVKGELQSGKPFGYSLVGRVVEKGKNINDLNEGDLVACAGNQYAYHAEYVVVSKNLLVKIPNGIDLPSASTVALGAIALQGVRRLNPTIGENIVVLGLGLIGILTCQILKNNGCRVFAIDIDNERLKIAEELGVDYALTPKDALEQIRIVTENYGVDGVVVTASGSSDEIISSAFKMCRKKGRVVLVGDVGLNIKRQDIYEKEIDFFISTSYGPGRYDKQYEEKGVDYPYSYVRWTENRNMKEYINMIVEEKLNLKHLLNEIIDFYNAPSAYERLKSQKKPLALIFKYPQDEVVKEKVIFINSKSNRVDRKRVNIAVIGAGGFAKGTHLPNLKKLSDKYNIYAIVSRTAHNAKSVAEQYCAKYCSTDIETVLNDKEIDLILISSRHNTHSDYALKALKAGKNVFVEKPLAVDREQLNELKDFFLNSSKTPILTVGFNRRFSPAIKMIKKELSNRKSPAFFIYRVNALFAPKYSWVHEDGGRIIGETCHFIDTLLFLSGSRINSIKSDNIECKENLKYLEYDNTNITIKFEDGSIGVIQYLSLGNKDLPKEYLEVHFDDKSVVLDDYKSLKGYGVSFKNVEFRNDLKGHLEELKELYNCLREGKWSISLDEMFEVTEATFKLMNI